MAAYASSVTLDDAGPLRFANSQMKMIRGVLTISNYNQTLAEITGITKYFKGTPTVLLGGAFSGGNHVGFWVAASKSVKAYVTSTGSQVASDVNMGTVPFVAIGI
ncbi:MAG: hypothetical protein E6Q97_11900 [Desulfurellales bacterium]|nr:MAG: hypothetical protein E6Q97_11900 [Desulfurellales bacterium]